MKVILIDDEHLALSYLEHQLLKIADVEIVGKFVNPFEGKDAIIQRDVDVVFLDINLPEISGIELAELLLESKPYLNIVFVTAYDDYAVQAFELNALDYVLKPVGIERLSKTIRRIQERTGSVPSGSANVRPLKLNMFQHFSMETDDLLWTPMRWRTSRAQELFLYFLQHRGQHVRKTALIDLLWPEYEPNKSFSQLYTAVYHIRKTLEPYAPHFKLMNMTDGYMLVLKNVTLDVEVWESFVQSGLPVTAETIQEYEKIMAIYTGEYLQEFDYWWAESERHRLKLLWLRISFQMAEWYLASNDQEKAIEKYLDICFRHPQAEEAHFALMKLYASTNNHLSVHRQYRLLTTILNEELNEQPSPYITDWYRKWNQDNKE
ncbi:response regulator [Paenibacillus ginsengihumi]|uniref:response regulator n=1 Tax=Paenibacillus ginsengihumi TaxID=431596 RepID=UPI000371D366|nr:response regulator [Paenibacillus ginsengihumi]